MDSNSENSKLINEKLELDQEESIIAKPATIIGADDQKQMNNFLGPMMKELEDAIAQHMKYLDIMEEDLLGDQKNEEYNRLVAHIPNEIRGRKSIHTIFKNLELMIDVSDKNNLNENVSSDAIEQTVLNYINEKDSNQADKMDTTKLEDLNNLACMSNSLSAYLLTKNSKQNIDKLKVLTEKFYDSVNLWLSRLFRFNNSSVLFYDEESQGLIRICNMVMNHKYKDYQKSGYESVIRKPVIYISEASKYASEHYRKHISIQLGLPLSAIKVVEVSKKNNHSIEKMDIEKFGEIVEDDLNEGFCPMILVANAGTNKTGQCDDLTQLNKICYKYHIWVHLEGIYLSTLALYSVPTVIQPVWAGDSVTLDLANWLGVPSLSFVTLYRNVENAALYIQPFNSFKSMLQKCLPYWSILQAMGHDGVIDRFKNANDISLKVREILHGRKPILKILNFKDDNSQKTTATSYSFQDLIAKALNFLTYVELNNPVIVFKCDPTYVNERLMIKEEPNSDIKDSKKIKPFQLEFLNMYADRHDQEKKQNDEVIAFSHAILDYTDTLTTWIFEMINNESKLDFELVNIEDEGICIKYCAFDHVNIYGTNQTDIDNFSKSITDLMTILDASIRCKAKFDKELTEYKNLLPVNVEKWAGVGAVRYIPDYLMDKLDEIKSYLVKKSLVQTDENQINDDSQKDIQVEIDQSLEQYSKEINQLNEQIIKKLQSQDNGFSVGEATDKLIAIKFGMIQGIDSLKKLFSQVLSVSKQVEESSRFIETMSDLIKQGIEKANEDLKKENEQKIVQEGVLRQIPLVGGLFSWISPSPSISSVGRTFNLHSGKILSTETTYKYHVQVEELNVNESDANKDSENSKSVTGELKTDSFEN